MTIDELKNKYTNIPQELKDLKRWVCYKIILKDEKYTKVPINAINGKMAMSNNELTWCGYNTAINGCIKYQCDGLGFMLGKGIFGVDLDNHPNENGEMTNQQEFDELCDEFINHLNSYTERSQSGLGIHIICKGTLPQGRKRNDNVEMYDSNRFFVMTGNSILNVPIKERTSEIVSLWEKYVDIKKTESIEFPQNQTNTNGYDFSQYIYSNSSNLNQIVLTDREVLEKAYNSKNGSLFASLMNGDLSNYNDDHSKADMALCTMLAFWTNKDTRQMDRIFRTSKLMRPKWDEMRGTDTYGNITINNALEMVGKTYIQYEKKEDVPGGTYIQKVENKQEKNEIHKATDGIMNLDKDGEPIFRIKTIFKKYTYTDTGNAERFYDYFGELFKYNVTDKVFMFWTGKCWIKDKKDIIKKYANQFIEILKTEKRDFERELASEYSKVDEANPDEVNRLKDFINASAKNITRVANKAGKEAMLSEFKALKDVPIESKELDTDLFLLNTDSGIVNLKTGDIKDFSPSYMQSKSTNIKISYDEPKVWKKFLNDIFYRGDEPEEIKETKEIVECIQRCIGYTLCGSTREQVMFILYGNGSNGKSTFTDVLSKLMGEYGDSIASEVIMQQKQQNNSAIYSIAKLQGVRYLETGETEQNSKIAEALIKRLTGGDKISAQFKFGNEFTFVPNFKLWMSTNNKPIVRGTDNGIWRRLFLFPFLRAFEEKDKDKDMPQKLEAELPMILGWAIEGFKLYQLDDDLKIPDCLKQEKKEYKKQMDVVTQFIEKNCTIIKGYSTKASTLFKNYKEWAKDECEWVMRNSQFELELSKKGFKSFTRNEEKFYKDIKLKTDKSTAYVFDNFDDEI